jgi:rod shape determining protein RodA
MSTRFLSQRSANAPEMTLAQRIWQINWSFVLLIGLAGSIGVGMLYSAAGGSIDPWADRQLVRLAAGIVIMLIVAVTDIRVWLRYSYLLYGIALFLLIVVEIAGDIGMGAQRWLVVGGLSIQPSEMMKITILMALARYFYASRLEDAGRITHLIVPVLMMLVPALLVLRQPDLGTATILLVCGVTMLFLAGAKAWMFIAGGLATMGAVFPIWKYVLHDYQRARLVTFMNPEHDPLGTGYHIMQSKIALGSGGIFGKGFLEGSQSHLSFLPEKHTDFIFTMLAEEFGMVGGLTLLGVYLLILLYGFIIALRCRNQFGRLLAMGFIMSFFFMVFVNIAMVMGLIPVVGMPLPLISYGGTSMLTLLFGFGLLMCVYVHRDVRLGPGSADGNP